MSTSDINTLSEKKMILVLLSVSGETLWVDAVDACGSTLENWVNTVKYEKSMKCRGIKCLNVENELHVLKGK